MGAVPKSSVPGWLVVWGEASLSCGRSDGDMGGHGQQVRPHQGASPCHNPLSSRSASCHLAVGDMGPLPRLGNFFPICLWVLHRGGLPGRGGAGCRGSGSGVALAGIIQRTPVHRLRKQTRGHTARGHTACGITRVKR